MTNGGMTGPQADALQRQIVDLTGDVRAVRRQMRRHERDHQAELEAQRKERRRLIGWAIGFLAAVDGPLATLLLTRR